MIIGDSGSGKTNALLNLISQKDDIDKIYLYAKDLGEPKYEFLIKRREDAGTKHLNDPNAFIECFNATDYVYENIDGYHLSWKRKVLIVFDDIIADIMTNEKFQAIIKEIRCRKLSISLVFITQSCFSVPKDVRLNSSDYSIMRINNKTELQNIIINHSADSDYKDFMKIYRECTKKLLSFLTIDTTLPASNALTFKKICFNLIKTTVTDQVKVLEDKIKWNKTQYDLGREAALSLSSKNLLDKYEYLTREDFGYKPDVFEKAKFEYSPLGIALTNNTKIKTNKNRADSKKQKTKKQDKYLVYNSQNSFAKFKDILIRCTKD